MLSDSHSRMLKISSLLIFGLPFLVREKIVMRHLDHRSDEIIMMVDPESQSGAETSDAIVFHFCCDIGEDQGGDVVARTQPAPEYLFVKLFVS